MDKGLMPQLRRWSVLILVISVVLLVDQASKSLIMSRLVYGESIQPIPALSPFFQITYTENRGAAFGFLPQAGDLFLIIAFVVMIAMLFLYPRLQPNAWGARIAVGLICGGALGNALDRLQHGAVIDFIHYQIPGVISNVSNLADHAIVIGVLTMLIESWRGDPRRKSMEEQEQHDQVVETE